MRLVCISDTHSHELVGRPLPRGDVLIHAGDLTSMGGISETTRMLKWLGNQKENFKHIILVAGNHDFLFERTRTVALELCRENGIIYLENQMVEIEGKTFFGSPWTHRFFNWAFMKEENELLEMYKKFPQVDVLITHGPARGVLDDNDQGEHCGTLALRDAIPLIRPRVHIFGHIHRSKFPCEVVDVTVGDFTYTAVNAAQVDDSNKLRSWKKPVVVEI